MNGRAVLKAIFAERSTAAHSPAIDAALEIVNHYRTQHGDNILAALLYGSCLRTGDRSGLLDLYLIVEDYQLFDARWWAKFALKLLPPNVFFFQLRKGDTGLQAKIAIMDRNSFTRAVTSRALDTTIWARFCQPSALVYARDETVHDNVLNWLTDAVVIAAKTAAPLLPTTINRIDFWRELFRLTYAAEIRTERQNRPDLIIDPDSTYYEHLTEPALAAAGIVYSATNENLRIEFSPAIRKTATQRWQRQKLIGKVRNLARLAKAVFTFDNAVDYAIWKIQRHSGYQLELTDWQRRHPILSAPTILWRLYKIGALR